MEEVIVLQLTLKVKEDVCLFISGSGINTFDASMF